MAMKIDLINTTQPYSKLYKIYLQCLFGTVMNSFKFWSITVCLQIVENYTTEFQTLKIHTLKIYIFFSFLSMLKSKKIFLKGKEGHSKKKKERNQTDHTSISYIPYKQKLLIPYPTVEEMLVYLD